jgi:hypothetical protein
LPFRWRRLLPIAADICKFIAGAGRRPVGADFHATCALQLTLNFAQKPAA